MDDYLIYFVLAGILGLVTIVLSFILNKQKSPSSSAGPGQGAQENVQNQRGRAAPARRQNYVQQRARQLEALNDDEGNGDGDAAAVPGDSDEEIEAMLNDPKLGTKKREKLLEKLERKKRREVEERTREDKKTRELKREEERKKLEEQEAENERLRLEEEKRLKEEQAQRELEEYNAMKAAFTVEEEGCDVADVEEEENLLEKFVNHIKARKVILFEELATQFGLKVPEAIDRLTQLVANGRLTGVMDDRGKFIYISEEELGKFAKFIKQRGRVSISEIVENSTSIINIVPDQQQAIAVE